MARGAALKGGLTVSVQGAAELRAALRAIPVRLGRTADANAKAGRLVVAEARRRAPVRTGRLRNSIRAKVTAAEVVVGSDVPYAVYQDQGTRYIRPTYFLSGAQSRVQGQITAVYEEFLRRAVSG